MTSKCCRQISILFFSVAIIILPTYNVYFGQNKNLNIIMIGHIGIKLVLPTNAVSSVYIALHEAVEL